MISGFDLERTGPGLHILTPHFIADQNPGMTPLDLVADSLVDINMEVIGNPFGISGIITIVN